ncbi:MAG: FctA domain-containing protein [Anaerococcus vaginalis]|nr:FctA domain-containing protein [Anaerococcus vaginalis]
MFFLFQTKVYANSIKYTLKVGQKISINSPYSKPQDSFDYILEPLTKNSPLPEGKSGIYKFSLKSDEEKQININYQEQGEYKYKLYQEKTNIPNVTQDKEIYTISIKIVEKEGQLVQDELIQENSTNKKVKEMNFQNIYKIKNETSEKIPKKFKEVSALNKGSRLEKVYTGVKENFILIISTMLVAINLFILINKGRDKEKVEKK